MGTGLFLGRRVPWDQTEVLAAQHCERAKRHGTVHFKWGNSLYVNSLHRKGKKKRNV